MHMIVTVHPYDLQVQLCPFDLCLLCRSIDGKRDEVSVCRLKRNHASIMMRTCGCGNVALNLRVQ